MENHACSLSDQAEIAALIDRENPRRE